MPHGGEFVADLGRNARFNRTQDETIADKQLEGLGQHFLADALNLITQAIEAERAARQGDQNEDAPATGHMMKDVSPEAVLLKRSFSRPIGVRRHDPMALPKRAFLPEVKGFLIVSPWLGDGPSGFRSTTEMAMVSDRFYSMIDYSVSGSHTPSEVATAFADIQQEWVAVYPGFIGARFFASTDATIVRGIVEWESEAALHAFERQSDSEGRLSALQAAFDRLGSTGSRMTFRPIHTVEPQPKTARP